MRLQARVATLIILSALAACGPAVPEVTREVVVTIYTQPTRTPLPTSLPLTRPTPVATDSTAPSPLTPVPTATTVTTATMVAPLSTTVPSATPTQGPTTISHVSATTEIKVTPLHVTATVLLPTTPPATVLPPTTLPTVTTQPAPAVIPQANTGAKHRMVALAFGQSNAGNYGDVPHASAGAVYNLRNGTLTRAVDPLRGAQGAGGSVWTLLGDQILAAGWYDEVVFVPVAYGGTEMGQWDPSLPLFKQIQTALDDVHGRGWEFTHLLWHHGESDNALKIGWGDYQLRFRNMLRGIRQLGVGAPIFVSVATRCGQYAVNLEIQGAQMNLVNHDAAIWAGPNTDTLDDTYRQEGCHFNDKGQHAVSNQWFDKLALFERR